MKRRLFKRTVLLSLIIIIFSGLASNALPSDWAKNDIKSLIQHNILPQELNINSKFQQKITREEFTKLMVNLYTHISNTPLSSISKIEPFQDTNNPYIGAAYNIGLVKGISSTKFDPTNYITRQEIISLVARELRALGIDTKTEKQAAFSDMYQVSTWAKADINYCTQEDIIKGIGNNLIAPLNNATREEAISIIERIRVMFSTQISKTNEQTSDTDSITQFEKEVIKLVNVERTKASLKTLEYNAELSSVARTKSQDMIDKTYFSHTSPTYGSPFDMMKSFGINYSYAGENIAMGQSTPSSVVNSWMNSDGHRENILSSNFTDLGVGLAKDSSGTLYWTQMFISTR